MEEIDQKIRSMALPAGSKIGNVEILRVIGTGPNGLVYESIDKSLQRSVIVKEYFPVNIAKRLSNFQVKVSSARDGESFDNAMKSFLERGIQLSRIHHPNIVQIYGVEECNGTVYMLMEKIEGELLSEKVKGTDKIAPEIVVEWVDKVLSAVKYIHDQGIQHLSIEPSNIIINDRLGPVLIDFGGGSGEGIVSGANAENPYRALEQSEEKNYKIGNFTDIFSIGAIFYYLISGSPPVAAATRNAAKTDPQTHLTTNKDFVKAYSKRFLDSIDVAINIRAESRFQNIDDWYESKDPEKELKDKKLKKISRIVTIAVAVLVGIWMFYGKDRFAEGRFWSALDASDPCSAQQYLDKYPQGSFLHEATTMVSLCKERVKVLQQKNVKKMVGELVQVSGGCFNMGSPPSEPGRAETELLHSVCVEPFEMAIHEVTTGKFKKFVEAKSYRTDAERNIENPGCWTLDADDEEEPWGYKDWASWLHPYKNFSVDDRFPVACVTAGDVKEYLAWLNPETGSAFRLPTEAEWAFANRGRSNSSRPWGERVDDACKFANVADLTNKSEITGLNSGASPWGEGAHRCHDDFVYTSPVGIFKSNHLGIYDLMGNVWELTCSGFSGSFGGSESVCDEAENPRVDRGGAWDSKPDHLRSAVRGSINYRDRSSNIGFRLVRGAQETK